MENVRYLLKTFFTYLTRFFYKAMTKNVSKMQVIYKIRLEVIIFQNPTSENPLKNPTSYFVEAVFKWVFEKWVFSKTQLKYSFY